MNLKKSGFRRAALVVALSALAGLAACGGGGGDADSTSTKVSGTVVDGPIRGATVFLDLNANFVHDAGEPISMPSSADGAFEIVGANISQAHLATALFVTHVPQTAFDADDGGQSIAAAGRQGFTLATPASAYLQVSSNGQVSATAPALLSPLTTLVAAEMAFNGLNIAAAKAKVQQVAALGPKDPMTNFVVAGDKGLGATARVIAIALGELARQISAGAQASSGSQRQLVAATVAELHSKLPSLLANVDTSGASSAPVPVSNVTAHLSTGR